MNAPRPLPLDLLPPLSQLLIAHLVVEAVKCRAGELLLSVRRERRRVCGAQDGGWGGLARCGDVMTPMPRAVQGAVQGAAQLDDGYAPVSSPLGAASSTTPPSAPASIRLLSCFLRSRYSASLALHASSSARASALAGASFTARCRSARAFSR